MGRSRRPGKGGKDNNKQLDLFKWVESAAARLGARLEDISFAALGVCSLALTIVWTNWSSSSEDSTLRPMLALTTFIAVATAALAWITRGLHSWFSRKGIPIAIHTICLAASIIVLAWALFATWHWDVTRIAQRAEQAARTRAAEAAKEQEVEKKRKAEQAAADAAAAAAAAKEAVCVSKRGEAIKKARRVERNATSRLDECKAEHVKKILSLQTLDAACKSAHDEVETAKGAVAAASGKVCNTGSITKGR